MTETKPNEPPSPNSERCPKCGYPRYDHREVGWDDVRELCPVTMEDMVEQDGQID